MKVRFDKIKDSGFMSKAVGTVVKTISKAGYPDGVYVVELEDGSKVQVPKKQATIVKEMKKFNEFINENNQSDSIQRDLDSVKKKFPKAKVSYYFAKHKGGSYVVTAKENGKTVFSSYNKSISKALDDTKVNESYTEAFERIEDKELQDLLVPTPYSMTEIPFICMTDKGEVLTYGQNGNNLLRYESLEIYEEEEACDGINPYEENIYEEFMDEFKQSIVKYLATKGYTITKIHLFERQRGW